MTQEKNRRRGARGVNRRSRLTGMFAVAVFCAVSSYMFRAEAQEAPSKDASRAARPANATKCDLSIPLQVALTPLNEPRAGSTARFALTFTSGIDPDLVKSMWIEYEVPDRLKSRETSFANHEIPRMTRSSRQELDLAMPEQGRYRVRARLMVELTDGRTISKTATRWIGDGPPEGVIGRIGAPDGTGIQVYQGVSGRN